MVGRIVFIEYILFVNVFTKIIVAGTVQRRGTHTEYSTIEEVKRDPFLHYNMQRRPNYSYNHYEPVNFRYWQRPGFVPSYNFSAQNAQYPYPGLRKQVFPRHPYSFGNGNAFNVLRILNPSTFGANKGALRQGMVTKELPSIITTEMDTEVGTIQPTETESTEVTSVPTLTDQALSEVTTDITEEHVTAQKTEDVYDAIPGWFGLAFASAEMVALTSKSNTTAENVTVNNGTVNVVQEAKSFMLDKKMGFFTAFGAKLCDVVASMPPQTVNELLLGIRKVIYDENMKDEIRYMGYPGGMALKISINTTMGWGPEELKARAARGSWLLQNQENLTDSLQTTLKTIDGVYNSEEGNNLLECLQVVRDYPANGLTNVEVATNVTNGILAPYRRTYGTAINRIFLLIINDELKKHYGGQFYFKTAISRRKLSNDFRNEVKTNKQIARKVSVTKTVGKYDMLRDRRKEKDEEQDFAEDKSQFSPNIGVASLYIKPKFVLEGKKQLKTDRIVEESSRSNEEKQLKMILSDTIRHGDRNFENMRRFNDVVEKKNRIFELSSFSDEEEVLKRNIYKVFGYNADLEVNN